MKNLKTTDKDKVLLLFGVMFRHNRVNIHHVGLEVLEKEFSFSHSYLRMIEAGQTKITANRLFTLVKYFECNIINMSVLLCFMSSPKKDRWKMVEIGLFDGVRNIETIIKASNGGILSEKILKECMEDMFIWLNKPLTSADKDHERLIVSMRIKDMVDKFLKETSD